MAFVNEPEKSRTIDYERKAELHRVGTPWTEAGAGREDFLLSWGDAKIEIEVRFDCKHDEDGVPTFTWNIKHLTVSPSLRTDKKALFELRQMLIDAFQVYGCDHGNYLYTPESYPKGIPMPYHVIVNIHPDIDMLKFGPEILN